MNFLEEKPLIYYEYFMHKVAQTRLASITLDKIQSIRVDAWIRKLSLFAFCPSPIEWQKQRNKYIYVLCEMTKSQKLLPPFCNLPPDSYDLPSIESCWNEQSVSDFYEFAFRTKGIHNSEQKLQFKNGDNTNKLEDVAVAGDEGKSKDFFEYGRHNSKKQIEEKVKATDKEEKENRFHEISPYLSEAIRLVGLIEKETNKQTKRIERLESTLINEDEFHVTSSNE